MYFSQYQWKLPLHGWKALLPHRTLLYHCLCIHLITSITVFLLQRDMVNTTALSAHTHYSHRSQHSISSVLLLHFTLEGTFRLFLEEDHGFSVFGSYFLITLWIFKHQLYFSFITDLWVETILCFSCHRRPGSF